MDELQYKQKIKKYSEKQISLAFNVNVGRVIEGEGRDQKGGRRATVCKR